MQATEQKLDVPVSPTLNEPDIDTHLTPEEADAIFEQAEAEIRPLLKKMRRERWTGWLQGFLCVSLMLGSLSGLIGQLITLPKTIVTIVPVTHAVTLTTPLPVLTRILTPVTVTKSFTTSTTGHRHQDARAASGILTFYNGNFSPYSIPAGTVFTAANGVKIATSEAVTVPAAQPPQFALASVAASAVRASSTGNIPAGAIHLALSSDLLVNNLAAFIGGRDARDYQAVARADLESGTSTLKTALVQQIPQAFTVRPGETVTPTTCTFTSTADHGIGAEAATVTLQASETCQGIAYSQDQFSQQARAAFTTTRPATPYQLAGQLHTSVVGVAPLTVQIKGVWDFHFTPDYEQYLAEHIAGDTPTKAKAYLLSTGVIAQANIPTTLPPAATYIDFFVLV